MAVRKAIDAGMRVAWFTLESLTATIGRAAVGGTTAKAIAKITRCDLIAMTSACSRRAGRRRDSDQENLGYALPQARGLSLSPPSGSWGAWRGPHP